LNNNITAKAKKLLELTIVDSKQIRVSDLLTSFEKFCEQPLHPLQITDVSLREVTMKIFFKVSFIVSCNFSRAENEGLQEAKGMSCEFAYLQ
jgi:hypothetical protein